MPSMFNTINGIRGTTTFNPQTLINQAQANQIDPAAINSQVQQQSASNAAASNAMEQQYNPYINQLRQQSAGSLSNFLQPNPVLNPTDTNPVS